VAFDDSTSNQIAIVTVKDLNGLDIAGYAVQLANAWGIGSSKNNGILILMKPRGFTDEYIDVTIQVGRGLEGAIPDVYASRIIRNIMGPYLRNDEYVPALAAGCSELMALASGEISEPRDNGEEDDDWIFVVFMFAIIIMVVVFISVVKSKNKGGGSSDGGSNGGSNGGGPIFFGPLFGPSGRGFGGGSSSGGFGGGFGGFGGGSFGGGGASGRF